MKRQSAEPETPGSWKVERGIRWFIVSNAAERSIRMTMEKTLNALAAVSPSVMARRAVSAEWPALNLD